MTDVEVPFSGEDTGDTAVLLLAAAEELGFGQTSVRTTAGAFVVPEEVRDKAFAKSEEVPKKAPAKKATAKKTAAKKK